MRLTKAVGLTLGFLIVFPAGAALASSADTGTKLTGVSGHDVNTQAVDSQAKKLRTVKQARFAQLQHKVLTDTSVKLLDLMMDRRRKKYRKKRRVRRERRKRIRRNKRIRRHNRKVRRHNRKVRRHNRKVRRHNRKVVRRHNRKVRRHNRRVRRARHCPAGYRWSSYGRRCIRSCRAGSYYSYVTGTCRRRGRHYRKCPANTYWSHSRRRCITYKRCGPGRFFSYRLGRCKRLKTNCSYGWRYSPYKRRCVKRCPTGWNWNGTNCNKPARTCPAGYRFSSYYKGCVRSRKCPAGYSWNGYRCRKWRRCAAGHYWSSYYKKCRPKVKTCPFGYRYRAGWGCVRRCGSGWHWTGSGCQKNARRCPTGKFYSHHRRRCVSNCGRGFFWSYRKRRCMKRRW